MPRMTAKYKGAVQAAQTEQVSTYDDQETLYSELQSLGYFWDSKAKTWEFSDIDDADEPTKLIMIRVWADAEIVDEAADDIIASNKKNFELVDRSKIYPCRPPKQREGRVYLKFLPKAVN